MRELTKLPIRQAVISASSLSLLHPASGLAGYSREEFVADLLNEAEADIRGALTAGAVTVQIDFTEARLSFKLNPSGSQLQSFVVLNNQVFERLVKMNAETSGCMSVRAEVKGSSVSYLE